MEKRFIPGVICTVLAGTVYLALNFLQLASFPPYLFCDEAVVAVDAHSLLSSGRDIFGQPWPLFFRGLGDYALSLTVYMQLPFDLLFGMTVWSVRARSACISLLGVLAMSALAMRFCNRAHRQVALWMVVILLAVTPAWFINSRTGFEYITAAVFYLGFIYWYLRGAHESGCSWYLAAVSAALCFYSYTPARGWVLFGALVLGVVNAPLHIRRWRATLTALALFVALLAPFLVLLWLHPEMASKRLVSLGVASVWDLFAKADYGKLLDNYVLIQNPFFWFSQQHSGWMLRHSVPGLSLIPSWLAPLCVVGAASILFRITRLENRSIVALWIVAPLPAALLEANSSRCLNVGCLYLLLSLVGMIVVWNGVLQVAARVRREVVAATYGQYLLCTGLLWYAGWFGSYVFTTVPKLYDDYGFYGLQYGAPQVYEAINTYRKENKSVLVASHLFNAGHIFIPFFIPPRAQPGVKIFDFEGVCKSNAPWPTDTVVFASAQALAEMRATGCPITWEELEVIKDPKGAALFKAVYLRKSELFAAWMAAQLKKRLEPVRTTLAWHHQILSVQHPQFDIGDFSSLVDGNELTIARTKQINPALIRFVGQNLIVSAVEIVLVNTSLADVTVSAGRGDQIVSFGATQNYSSLRGDSPHLVFEAPHDPLPFEWVELHVMLPEHDQFGSVHIGEITLR
ncbi:MAG: hypothetical protein EBZ48_04785 [Proteobacteria bacterium]|nr:hypothetical protein [Pseudomonadota bacterium]